MKSMVVLIDTNVLFDYLLTREDYESAKRVMDMCRTRERGVIAFHSLSIVWYVMRRIPDGKRRELMKKLLEIVDVTGTNKSAVVKAIQNEEFEDFEDCLQDICAQEVNADYIITRNIRDYDKAKVPAILPEDWLRLLLSED